jgi:hypothetical protein
MRILLILFLPIIAFGQTNCTGIVVDKSTGKRIPYATVGLTKENKGVSANEQGLFSINSNFPGTDSLRISSVGYTTLVIAVVKWVNGTGVEMQQRASLLRQVIISSNSQKQAYTLNKFGHCSWNWYRVGLEAVFQLAQRFDAPKEGMQLTGLELCKESSASIFRFRIYDVDSSCQCPMKDLSDTVIEVRSSESHVKIDLENYDIIIPGKSFFVAIEWLFIPFNEEHAKTKLKDKKTDLTYYKPSIRFVDANSAVRGKIWELMFNGKWYMAPYFQDHNFQITANLK